MLNKMLDSKKGNNAVEYLLSKSKILSKDDIIALAKAGADIILNLDDPFV
ncbi:MAG: hypothetical protein O6940_04880 [Ignavibacteria bacterium]|nr:hypothetical protein [Ignavibacteria bacterium]